MVVSWSEYCSPCECTQPDTKQDMQVFIPPEMLYMFKQLASWKVFKYLQPYVTLLALMLSFKMIVQYMTPSWWIYLLYIVSVVGMALPKVVPFAVVILALCYSLQNQQYRQSVTIFFEVRMRSKNFRCCGTISHVLCVGRLQSWTNLLVILGAYGYKNIQPPWTREKRRWVTTKDHLQSLTICSTLNTVTAYLYFYFSLLKCHWVWAPTCLEHLWPGEFPTNS